MQTVVLLGEPPHGASMRRALDHFGYRVLAELEQPSTLPDEVARHQPDIVVVATTSPTIETLESIDTLTRTRPRPVVMFSRDASRDVIRRAVDCGVGAYVVDGWAPQRLTPIIEAATARFEAYEAVRKELASTRTKLSERKLIEKAKGIVMQQRKLSEEEAYGALRKMAMDQNLALSEVARRVIAVAQLLG